VSPRDPSYFHRKDLLGLQDLEASEITHILDVAEQFREINHREVKKVPTLRGKSVVHLFFEDSTRTRTSFDLAAKRMSADTFALSGSGSSASKGETLLDTAKNLAAMHPDILIVRHRHAGTARMLARALPRTSIINAGDGACEHPTQGLLDLLTLRRALHRIQGLTVAIVGDIGHSRVARSNLWGLTKLGATVRVCGPPTLMPVGIEAMRCSVHHNLQEAVSGADAVIMLRVQKERIDGGAHRFPSGREYSRLYGLDRKKVETWLRPGTVILHPGPINRGMELEPEVADGPCSLVLDQVENGVAVRMAAMFLVLGGERGMGGAA
jgi:aspartate carbamoyltransferase catalytic subunit